MPTIETATGALIERIGFRKAQFEVAARITQAEKNVDELKERLSLAIKELNESKDSGKQLIGFAQAQDLATQEGTNIVCRVADSVQVVEFKIDYDSDFYCTIKPLNFHGK